ncbi:MAG: Imm42 family immunity protein [Waterburya sp.]
MPVFGNCSEFAVCYELDQDYGGLWLFGKFCYWIGGVKVGDYELGTSLRDVLTVLRSVVRDNNNREHQSLFDLSAEELYQRLNSAMYEDNSEYERIAQEECWARFQIDIPVDIFDNWKVFLVERSSKARIVYSYSEGNVVEVQFPSGVFDQAITDAFNTLFDIYEMETKTTCDR